MFEWPSLSQQEQQAKCRNGAKTNATAAGNGFKFQDEEEERFNNIFAKLSDEINYLTKLKSEEESALRLEMEDPNFKIEGQCFEMCSELEYKNRLLVGNYSIYEVDQETNQFSYKRAVKDYDRSAADEKVPVASELRTHDALKKTMHFLLFDILDSTLGTLDEWYDFLWSRTRAIRKELNQQRLSNELSINLLIGALNFHLISQERLKHYDGVGNFDQKLNSENIAACFTDLLHVFEANQELTNSDQHFNILCCYLYFHMGKGLPVASILDQIHQICDVNKSEHVQQKFRQCLDFIDAHETMNNIKIIQHFENLSTLEKCAYSQHIYKLNKTMITRISNCYSPKLTDEAVYFNPSIVSLLTGSKVELWKNILFEPSKDTFKLKKSKLFNMKPSFFMSLQNPISGQTQISGVVTSNLNGYFGTKETSEAKPIAVAASKKSPAQPLPSSPEAVPITPQMARFEAPFEHEKIKFDVPRTAIQESSLENNIIKGHASLHPVEQNNDSMLVFCKKDVDFVSKLVSSRILDLVLSDSVKRVFDCHKRSEDRIMSMKKTTTMICCYMIIEKITQHFTERFFSQLKTEIDDERIDAQLKKASLITGLKTWKKLAQTKRQKDDLIESFCSNNESAPSTKQLKLEPVKTDKGSLINLNGTDQFMSGLLSSHANRLKGCAIDLVVIANDNSNYTCKVLSHFTDGKVSISSHKSPITILRKVHSKQSGFKMNIRLVNLNDIDECDWKQNSDILENITDQSIILPLLLFDTDIKKINQFTQMIAKKNMIAWVSKKGLAENWSALQEQFKSYVISDGNASSNKCALEGVQKFILKFSQDFICIVKEKSLSDVAEIFFQSHLDEVFSGEKPLQVRKLFDGLILHFENDFRDFIFDCGSKMRPYLSNFGYLYESTNTFFNVSMLYAFRQSYLFHMLNTLKTSFKTKLDKLCKESQNKNIDSVTLQSNILQIILEICSPFKMFVIEDSVLKKIPKNDRGYDVSIGESSYVKNLSTKEKNPNQPHNKYSMPRDRIPTDKYHARNDDDHDPSSLNKFHQSLIDSIGFETSDIKRSIEYRQRQLL